MLRVRGLRTHQTLHLPFQRGEEKLRPETQTIVKGSVKRKLRQWSRGCRGLGRPHA